MSVHTPLATPAQIMAQTYYSPSFTGYPCDPSLIHEETDAERKRRKDYERRALREINCKRRKIFAVKAWEAIKDVIRNDDKDRSKRYKPLTAPLIPPQSALNFTSFTWPTGTAPPAFIPSQITSGDESLWPEQPVQLFIPTTHQSTTDPLPYQVQLNPYLAHQCPGHEPITYDVGKGPSTITCNIDNWTSLPFGLDGFDQPATWPSMTEMKITAVVDDPLPHFSWPITVSNPFGITCGDVFHAIWTSFHQNVSSEEYYSWTLYRQKLASKAYYRRIGTDLDRPDLVPGRHDGIKRIDYMGDSVMFGGLVSISVDTSEGWWMFVGPSR